MKIIKLSLRNTSNPNHHLWRNGGARGYWWLAATAHTDNYQKTRIRRSLKCFSISEARQRRDALLEKLMSESSKAGAQ